MIPRIIARLDVKGRNVIKGIRLEGLRVVGEPGALAKTYYEDGIDEIVYMDTVASLYGRNNILPVVQSAAQEIFVPLTVGGGMRSLDDVTAALRAGAVKVAVNTSAVKRPDFIREVAEAFGSQCLVLSIEAKARETGRWEAYSDNGRERTGRDVVEWAQEAEALGAGEILLTSVDQEGTKKGFDHGLFKAVRGAVQIPVIGCGGAGTAAHVVDAIEGDGLDAIAIAGMFHRNEISVSGLKGALAVSGIEVRR